MMQRLKCLNELKKEVQSWYKMRINIGSLAMTHNHSISAHAQCHLRVSPVPILNKVIFHEKKLLL